MTIRPIQLPSMNSIAAGSTASLLLPPGPTYITLYVRCMAEIGGTQKNLTGAEFPTVLGDIRLKVNGSIAQDGSADFFVKRAQFFGKTIVDGVLPIYLTIPWARTIMGEDLLGLGTVNNGQLQGEPFQNAVLEIDIKAGQNVSKLEIHANQGPPTAFHRFLAIRKYPDSHPNPSQQELANIDLGAHFLLAMDFTTANIDQVQVFATGAGGASTEIYGNDKQIRAQQLLDSGRVQQAGMTHLDFMPLNRVASIDGNGLPRIEGQPMNLNAFRCKLSHTVAPGSYLRYETTIYDKERPS